MAAITLLVAGGVNTAQAADGARVAGDTMTLITGDRVTVDEGGARVSPGPGRDAITFATQRIGGRLRVVPSDAFALIRAGRLDPRLFDVRTLLESGPELRLIVTDSGTAIRSRPPVRDVEVVRGLPSVNGMAVRRSSVNRDSGRLWRDLMATPTARIWLDGQAKLSLETSVKQIGAPEAWEKGHTGAGVKVAVLDTGIDATHPDLSGKVIARENFSGDGDERDLVGHGTHVASTIAGNGARRGVAPGATLLDAKVCSDTSCHESAIVAGMQWAAGQGAKIVNVSLGTTDTPGLDPMEQAVQTLTERYGILFVAAAGNFGKPGTIGSPASADAALTVGAVDSSDRLATFSSRGPRTGDSALKPDITAPGVGIEAARSKDSPGEGAYTSMTGTSMATPHVSGSAALLAGQHPGWRPETLKAALMGTARPMPDAGVYSQGAGRVDVARATSTSVTAFPSAVSFGLQPWPHGDDQPITRKVTYRNTGSAPATLRLSTRAVGERGDALPASLLSVTPDTVTVPANGEAEVSVTADTRADVADGFVGGYVEATADGGVSVSTPAGVVKEVESHELTLKQVTGLTTVTRTDVNTADVSPIEVGGTAGTVTLRLPEGTYLVESVTDSAAGSTMLIHPGLRLDAPQTVVLDAGLARPFSVRVPDASAIPLLSDVTYSRDTLDGEMSAGLVARSFDRISVAQLGPPQTYDILTRVAGQWATPGPDGSVHGSPSAYRTAWFVRGGVPTGFTRDVSRKELATVRRVHSVQRTGATIEVASTAVPAEGQFFGIRFMTDFRAPFTHTEYVNTGDGIRWRHGLREQTTSEFGFVDSAPTRYEAGGTYTEKWNRGVFGPSLVNNVTEAPVATRTGNVLLYQPLMYGDGAGRPGHGVTSRQRSILYRDGQVVAEGQSLFGRVEVPPADAQYRLVAETERGPDSTLSTRTTVAWTFRSAQGPAGERTALPLSVVGFAPALDGRNAAPAGGPFTVPFTVRTQAGSAAGPVATLSVDVSYDDGVTWKAAKVLRSGGKGMLLLQHPASDGFVSLRARSTDSSGNTVDQTIIRAYRIAR
ncbi:S8 family serine peptidase [Nonomuraea jabiensis]|uniref:S8 family serine peptidase n=1 Tax=Nonomuraea jabiensis TaxID=882448 RepID=UPI00342B2521